MAQLKNLPLEARAEAVSREALVQAALQAIPQNYREASLSNVARSYGVAPAYVSECVRAQTGKTYKELLQKHRMETAARLLRRSDLNISRSSRRWATRTPAISTACSMSATASAPGSTAWCARHAPAPRPEPDLPKQEPLHGRMCSGSFLLCEIVTLLVPKTGVFWQNVV